MRRRKTGGPALLVGIDEAGRGPILGPMVLACVALEPDAAASLTERGVTDSKRFGAGDKAHAARQALGEHIRACARHAAVVVIEVAEIDARTRLHELNRLEQEQALALLLGVPAIRDPGTHVAADGARIFAPLREHLPHLVAEDQADANHVAVAAASILAKVARDEAWGAICARYRDEFGDHLQGYAGGGYLNDATRRFLRAYCERYRCVPPEGRQSWPWDFVVDILGEAGLPPRPAPRAAPKTQKRAAAADAAQGSFMLPGFD